MPKSVSKGPKTPDFLTGTITNVKKKAELGRDLVDVEFDEGFSILEDSDKSLDKGNKVNVKLVILEVNKQ